MSLPRSLMLDGTSLLDDLLKDLLSFVLRDVPFAKERSGTSLLPLRVSLGEAREDLAHFLL